MIDGVEVSVVNVVEQVPDLVRSGDGKGKHDDDQQQEQEEEEELIRVLEFEMMLIIIGVLYIQEEVTCIWVIRNERE